MRYPPTDPEIKRISAGMFRLSLIFLAVAAIIGFLAWAHCGFPADPKPVPIATPSEIKPVPSPTPGTAGEWFDFLRSVPKAEMVPVKGWTVTNSKGSHGRVEQLIIKLPAEFNTGSKAVQSIFATARYKPITRKGEVVGLAKLGWDYSFSAQTVADDAKTAWTTWTSTASSVIAQ